MSVQKILRVCLGFIFLWPFLDKTFGLGISTVHGKAWIDGVSPTAGFLAHAHGPFGALFQNMSGSVLVDWLFMLGLLGVGLALMLGVGMKIASHHYAGRISHT